MSSYCPNSAHHLSAACPSTRRSSTSRQVVQCGTSVFPRRHRCYGRKRQDCSGHATPFARSATSEYARQVARHMSRTGGLRSITGYRLAAGGRTIAPTPRTTADISDPAVSQQGPWASIHPEPHLIVYPWQRMKNEVSHPPQHVYGFLTVVQPRNVLMKIETCTKSRSRASQAATQIGRA